MKEATENRARVEEIMGALRPQERRLAALARQETGREELLNEAVERIARLGSLRAAWLAARGRRVRGGLDAARSSLDSTRNALRSADAAAQGRRERLAAARSELAAARVDLEAHRTAREEAERSLTRAEAESVSLGRDLARLDSEVAVAESEVRSVEALRAAAEFRNARRAMHARECRRLADDLSLPQVHLPLVPGAHLDHDGIEHLVDATRVGAPR